MALDMEYEPPEFYEFEVSPHPFPPTPPFPASVVLADEDGHQGIENLKTALMAAAVVSLIFMIAKDAHKAFMRRAHWIPCDFLVLSAFSIQLLNMLNTQNQDVGTSSNAKFSIKAETTPGAVLQYPRWKDFLMIHNSRTILCVFTAYVMPAMADPGLEHAWVRWVALVITVFHHLTSQYYTKKDSGELPNFLRLWPQANKAGPQASYYVYATIISLAFILLILLLACSTIAGRSIQRIVAKKISLVLRGQGEFCAGIDEKSKKVHQHPHAHHHCCGRIVKFDVKRGDHHYHLHQDHSSLQTDKEAVVREDKGDEDAVVRAEKADEDAAVREGKAEKDYRRYCHYCWNTVEDAVLKAWIIVRAYSVQPVLARSAMTASAAIVVTIQIAITFVGGLSKALKVGYSGGPNDPARKNVFKLIAAIVESIFIVLAWALINFRWAIAVAYHKRPEKDDWCSVLRVEDFWTRHLKELRQAEQSPLEEAQSLDREIEQLASKKQTAPTVPRILLYAAFWLQWLLVSFSKVWWLASLMIFHNKLMHKLFSFMFQKYILCVFENYPKYEKILQDVQMLGESPESLWVANRKSIEEAKSLIIQGNQDGEYKCDDLVDFLIRKRTTQVRPIQKTEQPQEKKDVEKQQSRGRGKEPLAVEEKFADVNTKSWKMAAVSLLTVIVHFSPIDANSTSHAFTPEAVDGCFKAYSQAWEIVDFVEEALTESDGITSEAADMAFQVLQKKVRKAVEDLKKASNGQTEPSRSVNCISGLICQRKKGEKEGCPNGSKGKDSVDWKALDELKKKSKSKREQLGIANGEKQGLPKGWKGDDSIDWKASALSSAVSTLYTSIKYDNGSHPSELRKELENSLADIINECLQKVQDLLLLKSRKWALNRDEKRLGKALYTAGKAKVIMEKLACNKLSIVSYH